MVPFFDLRTAVLMYVGIRTGQALVLIYLWRVQRNYPPAKNWALGAFLSAAGLFFLSFRGFVPIWISEGLSNAMLLPGVLIFDCGIASAAGGKMPVKFCVMLCLVVLGIIIGFNNVTASVVAHNMAIICFDACVAWICLRASFAKKNLTFRFLGILFSLLVMTCLWRVVGGVFGITFGLPLALPLILWLSFCVIVFPMVTMLLALHTSQRLQEEINDQARHDMLTGAYNRRAFDEFITREWARAERHGYAFSVLTVDIDHFKLFNDQHGHPAGDAALVQVSNAAQATLRTNDIWCRYGGEEFIALLPDTPMDQAMQVAERLRASVESTSITTASGVLNISVSIGVTARAIQHAHWTEMLAQSDAALYKAKAAGRNCVIAGDDALQFAGVS